MKAIDKTFVSLGMIVAGILTWYAYYSNLHPGAPELGWFVYVVLCPPSIGLMATEHATKWGQAIIVLTVVAANGALYGVVSLIVREALRRREG
jgi:hypothetical protein